MIPAIIDWPAVLQKAARHRLQLRLYSFLKKTGTHEKIEPAAWEKIRLLAHRSQSYVMAHEAELTGTLLSRFNEAGIDVLLLKGAALL